MPDFIEVGQLVQNLQCGSTELHAHTQHGAVKKYLFPLQEWSQDYNRRRKWGAL